MSWDRGNSVFLFGVPLYKFVKYFRRKWVFKRQWIFNINKRFKWFLLFKNDFIEFMITTPVNDYFNSEYL